MAAYQANGRDFDEASPDLQQVLARLHGQKIRPVCLCRQPPLEAYIARLGDRFVIKRMPDTGPLHATDCDHYEPPAELSGLGEVFGSAIQESADDGKTSLRLAFSLSKGASRKPPAGDGAEPDSVTSDGRKLTLRGTLHYLWDQAGLTRWTPGMEGKRHWAVVRRHLLLAAAGAAAKGAALDSLLYVPEAFSVEHREEIDARRSARLAPLIAQSARGSRPLMVAIAEVKDIAPARYGHRIIARHLGNFPFLLPEDLHKRMAKRFARELELWGAVDGARLVMIGTFGITPAGIASMEELALMTVTDHWIPFEDLREKQLLDELDRHRRSFRKGLRYNLASSRPLAQVLLSDTQPTPAALYILPAAPAPAYLAALRELVTGSKLPAWFWEHATGAMPALPPRSGYQAMPFPELISGAASVDAGPLLQSAG